MTKKVAIAQFGGLMPRANPAMLPDNTAQVAQNCTLWNGDLRALKAPAAVITPTALGGAIKSIYRIGQSLPEPQYWMAWTTDVNVVRGLIAGDTSERTYYTGDGVPKVTNLQLATQGGTTYPVASYTLGIPKPAAAPTCAPSSTTAPVETRVYLYTYVSVFGEEGVPSAPTKVVVASSGSVALSGLSVAPSGNFNIVSKRIYRSQLGSSGAAIYRFVAEIAVATTSYNDTVAGTDLGEAISTLDYDMPPATMQGIVEMPNGIFVGFDGYDILFCEPFKPYAWPQKYRLTASWPVVGLGTYGSSVLVLTKGMPYLISGVDPANMTMEKIELDQSCVSKRSIASIGGAVVYASPDGLVYVGAGGSRILTKELYTRDEWQALNPAAIDGYWIDGRYVGVFSSGQGFILNSMEDASLTLFDDVVTAGYKDLSNDALYVCIGGAIKRWAAGSAKTFTWRSKKYQQYGASSPSCARVDADAYPVTFKLYANGVLGHTETVASPDAFRLPSIDRMREFEFELSGSNPVRFAGISDDPEDFNNG